MDIKNKRIEIPVEQCDELADQYFMITSGIDRPGQKYERMKKEAFEIRQRIRDRVNIRAILSYYSRVEWEGQTVTIGGVSFRCNGFEQVSPDSLKGAFVHMLTAGDYHLDGEPIMNQLFADIWGTAFTEAGRTRLDEILREQGLISDSFGPGFYGMETLQMKSLSTLLDPESIGLEVRATGILVPLKSCGGITFSVNEKYLPLEAECADCRGNKSGCSFCVVQRKRMA